MKRSKAKTKVLISGASIAGPTLARWLHQYGFEVTVVERSSSLRLGGQNIDVSGLGREVAEQMGIIENIKTADTGELGIQFIGQQGEVKAKFPKTAATSFTNELEIIRGDLVQILFDLSKAKANYIFGDHITGLNEVEHAVQVMFASGKKEKFDLVVAADGLRSTTRELMFGKITIKDLGLYGTYLTIPRTGDDNRWARWYNAPGSSVMLLRPDTHGSTRASFFFLSKKQRGLEKLPPEKQKELLLKKLQPAGWEAPRLSAEIKNCDDIYFDGVSQVKAEKYTSGRLAMIGDAAYCPSPITGMGTTLAFTGAYILAGELSQQEDYEQAFAAYEEKMRPIVKNAQKLPPGVPWIVYPESKFGVNLLNQVFRFFASKPVQKLIRFFSGRKTKQVKNKLPVYRQKP